MSWNSEIGKRIRGFSEYENQYVEKRINWKSVWDKNTNKKYWVLVIPAGYTYLVCVKGIEMAYSTGYAIIAPNIKGEPDLVKQRVITSQELQIYFTDNPTKKVTLQGG